MAAESSFILEEEELSCPICFEEFTLHDKLRHPKLLWCLHTFCLECMETLRKYDGSLQCSICRTSHHVYSIRDLMDNYVIYEHLKSKQEREDEKFASQLKEEYDASERQLQQQEERDAQIAREEEEKNRLEEEQLRLEEERIREEARRLEEERQKEEEQRRLAEERRIAEEREKEDEDRNENTDEEVFCGDFDLIENSEDESMIGNTDGDSDARSEGAVTDGESETDLDDDLNDPSGSEGEHDDEERDRSPFLESVEDVDSVTSIVDDDDDDSYETLSSDSVHIISSDDEDEMGTALSTTAPIQCVSEAPSTGDPSPATTSPEPDLLSEEFSGVAKSKAHSNSEESSGVVGDSNDSAVDHITIPDERGNDPIQPPASGIPIDPVVQFYRVLLHDLDRRGTEAGRRHNCSRSEIENLGFDLALDLPPGTLNRIKRSRDDEDDSCSLQ